MRPAASWPDPTEPHPPIVSEGDALPTFPDADAAVAVRHGSELLGALTVTKPPNDPVVPEEDKLLADLAAQAGLILENFRLIEDLRSSRQRLVAAQDEERRRLERNIHDGAQQQLVALAVKVRLAEGMVGRDEQQQREALHGILDDAQDALENLRDLARGIYPPLLADRGLAEALGAQARKSPLPVIVDSEGIGRYPREIEAAVYFSVLEAMQNVAKYAQASHVAVRLRPENGSLAFSVTDDGRGFDKARTPYGMGLQNMSDRLAALGGSFDVRTAPGHGTTVLGRVPADVGNPVGSPEIP